MKKHCKHCNKEFEPKSKKGVYCSTNCRIKAHQSRGKKIDATNEELVDRFVPDGITCDLCGKKRNKHNMGSQSFRYERTGEKITILICQDHFFSSGDKWMTDEDMEKARTLAIVRGSKGTAKFKEGGLVYIP